VKVMFQMRTAMNFFMLLATSAASFFLVIGRRFAVKSVVGIYDVCEIRSDQMCFAYFYLRVPGRAPNKLERKIRH